MVVSWLRRRVSHERKLKEAAVSSGRDQAPQPSAPDTARPLIFISYARADREHVDLLADQLATHGFRIWYDRYLTGGQDWWNEILAHILRSTVFMPVVSYALLDSQACHKEYQYASALNRLIVPLFADDLDYHVLPWNLVRYQGYRLGEFSHQAQSDLIKKTESVPLPDPLPESPSAPLSPIGQINERIMAESVTEQEQASLFLRLKYLQQVPAERDEATRLLALLRNRPGLNPGLAAAIDAVLQPSVSRDLPQIPLSIQVEPVESDDEETGYFQIAQDDRGIVATAHIPYLEKLEQGGPVGSVWYSAPLPTVNIRLVNNTPQTVLFTEAVLQVERSEADERPTLICWNDADEGALLRVENRGWGQARDVVLRFSSMAKTSAGQRWGIDEAESEQLEQISTYTGNYAHVYRFDQIDIEEAIDIAPALRADGYAASSIRESMELQLPEPASLEGTAESPEDKSNGARAESAIIFGELLYHGVRSEAIEYRFYTSVGLQPKMALYRRMPPPVDYYHALLRSASGPYQVTVPLTHFVRPGEAEWFGIELSVYQSSTHRLRISMHYNEGQTLHSLPLTLHVIVPRTANRFRRHNRVHMQELHPLEVWTESR